jgi:hypothetical protein
MNTDTTTRLLLTGILVCLIALVAQGFGGSASEAGRYTLTGMRAGSPVLIRTDTATGEVWKLELRGGGGVWQLFQEEVEVADSAGDAAQAALPTLPVPSAPATGRDDDMAAAAELPRLDQPERRRGPKINFAPPAPKPSAPSVSRQPSSQEELESFLAAVQREDLPTEIRVWSVAQIGESDDPRSTEALLDALDTEDAKVRAAVIEALGTRDDPRVAEALSKDQ